MTLPPDQLIDREEEASKLQDLAEGGHNTRLSAPRRFGKTTLLRKVAADADKAGMVTVYVDFSGVLTVADVALNIEGAYRLSLKGAVRRFVDDVLRTLRPGASVGTPAARLEVQLQPDDELMRRLQDRLGGLLHEYELAAGRLGLCALRASTGPAAYARPHAPQPCRQ